MTYIAYEVYVINTLLETIHYDSTILSFLLQNFLSKFLMQLQFLLKVVRLLKSFYQRTFFSESCGKL